MYIDIDIYIYICICMYIYRKSILTYRRSLLSSDINSYVINVQTLVRARCGACPLLEGSVKQVFVPVSDFCGMSHVSHM